MLSWLFLPPLGNHQDWPWTIGRVRMGSRISPLQFGIVSCLSNQHCLDRLSYCSHCLGVTMVGSPLPAPPRKAESFTHDSSFLSLLVSPMPTAGPRKNLPGECSDIVDYSNDQFSFLRVYSYDKRIVHDVQVGQEEGWMSTCDLVRGDELTVIEEGGAEDPLRVLAQVKWVLVNNCR
jgi:hypothetical protein